MQIHKAYKGLPMEGPIATWYAQNTRRDVRRFETVARSVAEQLPPGRRVLEVAPGPGYLAIELAKAGYRVTAVDISKSFVRIARENAARAGVPVDVHHGNASALPLANDSFDFIVSVAAFKNFADPIGALNEMHRVLVPGGRAWIHDLRKDISREEIDREVGEMQLSTANAAITRFVFRFGLVKAAYTREDLERMARASRFGRCEIVPDGIALQFRLTRRLDG